MSAFSCRSASCHHILCRLSGLDRAGYLRLCPAPLSPPSRGGEAHILAARVLIWGAPKWGPSLFTLFSLGALAAQETALRRASFIFLASNHYDAGFSEGILDSSNVKGNKLTSSCGLTHGPTTITVQKSPVAKT